MVHQNLEKSAVRVSLAGIAERLVEAEMLEAGVKRPDAERTVARRAGLSPSTIENLKRGRIKNEEAIGGRIRKVFVAFLERRIGELETELAVSRMVDRECDFSKAEAAIATAREALNLGEAK